MNYEVHITENKKQSIHHFNSDNFYENKIKARLFFDNKVNELSNANDVLIELFFIQSDAEQNVKLFIKNSLGLENNENKQIENRMLNKTTQPIFEQKQLERDRVRTKNSFLDGN